MFKFTFILLLSLLSGSAFSVGWEDAEEAKEVFTFDTREGEHENGVAAPGGGLSVKPRNVMSKKAALKLICHDEKVPLKVSRKACAEAKLSTKHLERREKKR